MSVHKRYFSIQNLSISLGLMLTACGASDVSPTQNNSNATTVSNNAFNGWSINTKGDLNGFFECLEEKNLTLISAHRAGSYKAYPENSLETAQYISSEIPAFHEIDVATSKDGVLFLMHDDTLDRTTNGAGNAKDKSWAQIQSLKLKDKNNKVTGFNPPTLESFLNWAKGRALIQIDFKRSTRFEDVINMVKKTGTQDNVIYIAYTMAQARKLHRLDKQAMISISIDSQSELNSAIASGIPEDKLIAFTGTKDPNPRLFSLLNNRDIEVIFGTLGGRRSIDAAIERNGNNNQYADLSKQGVDILATDRPLEAYQVLVKQKRGVDQMVCGIEKTSIPAK